MNGSPPFSLGRLKSLAALQSQIFKSVEYRVSAVITCPPLITLPLLRKELKMKERKRFVENELSDDLKNRNNLESSSEEKYDKRQEPIVLSKVTSDIFLKQENPADLIALYWFYYYTAKWQGTNNAKATTSYTAKGLKWGEDKVRRVKKQLIELELIEDIRGKRDKYGSFGKCYIYVKFIWWIKEKINKFNDTDPRHFPQGGETDSMANPEGNALTTDNLNALTTDNKIVSKDTYVSSKHNDIISSIINFWNNLPNTTTHSNTETKLYKNISLQIENLLCGKPLIRKKDNSPTEPFLDFVESNNISRKIYLKKWKEEDIKKTFQIINDEIEKDSPKKISLGQTLWNAFAKKRGGGFSLFLHIAANTDFDIKRKSVVSEFIRTIGKRTDYKTKIQWGKQFDDFINQDEVPEDEIMEVLDWYRIHKGEKYIPVIDSPAELQEKYSKLKAAISRSREIPSNSQPVQQAQQPNPTRESLNLFANEKIEVWVEEYASLTNLLANANIWPPNYTPNKDKIYSALLEIKNWKNNMIHDDYSQVRRVTGSVRIICNEYIDWIGRQRWLEDGIKEGSLFPNSKMFKQHFIPDLEGDILDLPLRSRGWGKDENLKMENVTEIETREKQEEERRREQKEIERINAENREENVLWMHTCMKKHLLDLDKINIKDLDITKWEKDLNKQEFEKFVISVEKKHQENPTNRGNSYRFLFLKF